ncbi:MAG: hypothetical protein QNJ55_09770 [Xenococcus sp. MO_188.B8]|nr:hypothetical protein [Xenococcus sp. MO_188.B8]
MLGTLITLLTAAGLTLFIGAPLANETLVASLPDNVVSDSGVPTNSLTINETQKNLAGVEFTLTNQQEEQFLAQANSLLQGRWYSTMSVHKQPGSYVNFDGYGYLSGEVVTQGDNVLNHTGDYQVISSSFPIRVRVNGCYEGITHVPCSAWHTWPDYNPGICTKPVIRCYHDVYELRDNGLYFEGSLVYQKAD